MTVAHANIDIPALKARHPLGSVVEASGLKLRGRGRVRQGVCPFHEETEGSFTVYADSNRFYCFGCGLGGDVLDFIQRSEDLSLPEAIRRLQGGSWSFPTPVPPVAERQASSTRVARDPALLTAAARFYAAQLQRSPKARRYLASRGISLAAAQRLGLGYSSGPRTPGALASAAVRRRAARSQRAVHGTRRTVQGDGRHPRTGRRPRPLAHGTGDSA